ncbi:unnamed protein product, partial [Mesorhabditis spiculigera]
MSDARNNNYSLKEYAEAQRELGSCMPEFKDSVKRMTKAGLFFGIPLGVYVSYVHGHRQVKPIFVKTLATTLASVMTFASMGLVIGTFNCLRVKMN